MKYHYQKIVEKFYSNEDCYYKALSSAKNLENSMNVKYNKDGSTNCHFRMNEYWLEMIAFYSIYFSLILQLIQ